MSPTTRPVPFSFLISLWWSMAWRSLLAGLLLGAVFGFIAGLTYTLAGGDPADTSSLGSIAGYFGGLLASIWALRVTLLKPRAGYVVNLQPSGGTPRSSNHTGF